MIKVNVKNSIFCFSIRFICAQFTPNRPEDFLTNGMRKRALLYLYVLL